MDDIDFKLLKLISNTELKRVIENLPPYKSPTSWATAMAAQSKVGFVKALTEEADRRGIKYKLQEQ